MRAMSVLVGVVTVVALGACSSDTPPDAAPPPAPPAPLTPTGREAVAEYRAYLTSQVDQLLTDTQRFADAVKTGDVAQARALYPLARAPYERIEPVAELVDDLDTQIAAREGDVPADEWGGFHRIEKQLWTAGDTTGMNPVADQLLAAVTKLRAAVRTVELSPPLIADTAVDLLNEIGTLKITGEENRYAHTDLSDIAASVGGARAALDAVTPMLRDPAIAQSADTAFDQVNALLEQLRRNAAHAANSDLTEEQLRDLGTRIDALADMLAAVPALVSEHSEASP